MYNDFFVKQEVIWLGTKEGASLSPSKVVSLKKRCMFSNNYSKNSKIHYNESNPQICL